MKLNHIFWTLLIMVLVLYIPSMLYRNDSKLGGGAELMGFFLLVWLTTTIVSPVILILRRVRIIKRNLEFILTLLTIFNFYFGTYGIYMILSNQIYRPGPYALKIFIVNLIWAMLTFLQAIKGNDGFARKN